MTRAWRRAMMGGALAVAAACSGSSTGPVAGLLKVNLVTPNSGADGAIMVLLSSPTAPVAITAGSGLTLWGSGASPSAATTVVLTGTVQTGTILTLQVDDINKVRSYTATIQQVAAASGGGFALRALGGYTISVTK